MALTEIDRNLLKRCLSKEPGAWKDFVDRFIGLFVHVIHHAANARSVRVSPHDVDDLCAEVFLALLADDFSILRRFRGKSSLATYLTVVARRIVIREMSKRRLAEAIVQSAAATTNDAEPHVEAQRIEDREEVQRLLEDLAETDAEVVRQYHLEGRSYREISSHLGIPENSIGPMLSRARDRMRRRQMQS